MPAPPVKLGNIAWGEDTYLGSADRYIIGWNVPYREEHGFNILCSSYCKAVLVSAILGDSHSVPGEIMVVSDIAADGTYYYKSSNEIHRSIGCAVLLNHFEYGHSFKVYNGYDRITVAHLSRGALFLGWLELEQEIVVGDFLQAGGGGALRKFVGGSPAVSGVDRILGVSLTGANTVGEENRVLIKVCVF